MLNNPFSPWPSFTEDEAEAVAHTLLSNKVNYWTGDECRKFELEFAHWCGTSYAIAVSNGTLALDLALHGLGIGSANGGSASDEVIVTPRSFIASVSCVVNAGARPVFADVDVNSGNLSAATIENVVTANTRGVILVHLAGWPCDVDPIMALAAQHEFKVIEDCAQAHGATYKGRSVGALGHVAAWSFCQDKIITTGGEGGMVTCSDDEMWRRMWAFKDHGKSFDAVYNRKHPPGFRWLHESIGTNWRMLEMQAVIGRLQLEKLPNWTIVRNANAAILEAAFKPFAGPEGCARLAKFSCLGCNGCEPARGCRHANYRFYAYVRPERLAAGWSRDRIVAEIVQRGVPAYQGTCSEIYREKAFQDSAFAPAEPLPTARQLGETSLMFLVHPNLTQYEMATSARAISDVMMLATAS